MTKTFSHLPYRLRHAVPSAMLMASVFVLCCPQLVAAQSANSGLSLRDTSGLSSADASSSTDPYAALSNAAADDRSGSISSTTTSSTSSITTLPATGLRPGVSMLQGTPLNQADGDAGDDLATLTEPSENQPEQAIEAGEAPNGRGTDSTGLKLGTFTLRASTNQSLNSESVRDADGKTHRTYYANTLNGTLTSDWARHALTITGSGTWQKNISGTGETEPNAALDADLRLDLSDQTIAHLTAGYGFEREETTNPNAISGASEQARVDRFTGGASIERDMGVLRGTAAISATRTTYGSVSFPDGTRIDLSDRDRNAVEGRVRLGYELSPALIPFIEATLGRAVYDDSVDSSGYARSSWSYGGRGGVQLDLGEKLRGELGLGYATVTYEDARLASIDAFTVDGTLLWSPQRGTDVNFGLRTTVQDSTTAGQSGWVEYQASSGLSHQLLNDLTGRVTASATLRDFAYAQDQVDWTLGTGLIWNINRYLDATANLAYELNDNPGGVDTKRWRAGVGLTLRR